MVLVTGGTGLVGSHLLYQLTRQRNDIVAIHRRSSDLQLVKRIFGYYTDTADALFAKITWKEADITDITSLQEVFLDSFKLVYHCAAMISFDSKDYYELRKVNIKGTANLVNLSLENEVEKFCFVSSIATLDELPGQKFITEGNEWNAELKHHGYAITKYGAEMEVWRASQEGLDVIIVNPGVILGPGLWNTAAGKLFSSVANEFKYYTEGITGFVGIEDVIKSMLLLMKSTIKNERFILVSENLPFRDVLDQIADCFAVKKPSIKVSKTLTEVAWRLDSLKSLLMGGPRRLTKHTARSGHHKNYYSSDKVISALDYDFQPVVETVRNVCEIYKKEKEVTS